MLKDDGDVVKAIGYVALYSSYLEEQIELLIDGLEPVKKYEGGWPIRDKIRHAKKALRKLDEKKFQDLIHDLHTCIDIFEDRNELLHGRIYSGLGKPDTLRSSRPGVPDRPVASGELYEFANELSNFRKALFQSARFSVPRAVASYRGSD